MQGGSDALIGNLCVNAKGHVPQLVLDGSIKLPAANGWLEEVGLPVSCRQDKLYWFPATKHYSKYLSYCFASEGSQQRSEHNTLSTENLNTLLIHLILGLFHQPAKHQNSLPQAQSVA